MIFNLNNSVSILPTFVWEGCLNEGITIESDDSSYLLKTSLKLTLEAYMLISQLDVISITVLGVTHEFIVVSKSSSESENDEKDFTIELESPATVLSAIFPDSEVRNVTKTWENVTESAICAEMASGIPFSWELEYDQTYEKYTVEDQAPIDVIADIVARTKSLLVSMPNGNLVATTRYKKSLWDMHEGDEDVVISDMENAYSNTMTGNTNSIIDVCYIGTSEQHEPSLSVETEMFSDCQHYIVRVYPFPFRATIGIEHTGIANISISSPVIKTMTIEHTGVKSTVNEQIGEYPREPSITQLVEFQNGTASVSYPVHQVISYSWNFQDLGEIVANGTELKASQQGEKYGYSLATFVYTTQYIEFIIFSTESGTVQFLVGDTVESFIDELSGYDVVSRGWNDERKMIVNDEYLLTPAARFERGKNELNQACGSVVVEITANPISLKIGDIAKIDSIIFGTYFGYIKSNKIVVEDNIIYNVVTLEKVDE